MSTTSGLAIDEFMEQRWLDAKEILAKLDPAFVHALEIQDSAGDKGIFLPQELLMPSPLTHFASPWNLLWTFH